MIMGDGDDTASVASTLAADLRGEEGDDKLPAATARTSSC
jgi:hypothetical protein